MNFLLAGILIVLVLILIILCVSIYKSDKVIKPLRTPEAQASIDDTLAAGDNFRKYTRLMLDKLEDEKRAEQEREMMEYAQSKIKDKPLLPSSTNENQGEMTSMRSQAKELVPFNLNPTERAIWEEFNS